ncbi:hypothetical protein BH09ACT6_BH09ACT6_00290 [soil metagenome]
MTITTEFDLPAGLGAAKPVQLPATRYRQGGREMYHMVVPLAALPQIVARPDPSRPIEGNRKVNAKHAADFGDYVLDNKTWVAPSIIVRAPSGDVTFEAKAPFDDGAAWGILSIPLHVLTEILILDGQHRSLGIFLAIDKTNARIANLVDSVRAAHNNGDINAEREMQTELDRQKKLREKLGHEHLSIDIALVSNSEASQLFADINTNLRGVSKDFTTILDQRNVVNRIALELIENHPLLVNRVETGQENRMSSRNPNLLGAKSVADIVRAVLVGSGRISARRESEIEAAQADAVRRVGAFLDVLVDSFEDLEAIANGDIDPVALRESSMLGSATMLRVLAIVYHDLTNDPARALSRSEVSDYLHSIEAHMREVPVEADNEFWMSTRAFVPGSTAPQARTGAVGGLVSTLTARAREYSAESAEVTS